MSPRLGHWTCALALALATCAPAPAGATEAPANAATRRPAPAAPEVAPSGQTASAAPRAAAPAAAAPARSQAIRGDDVHIEGKLDSPQALFIVSRTTETFGRDAVVPHTLRIVPGTAFLPYRLHSDDRPDSTTQDEH